MSSDSEAIRTVLVYETGKGTLPTQFHWESVSGGSLFRPSEIITDSQPTPIIPVIDQEAFTPSIKRCRYMISHLSLFQPASFFRA